ncbi:MAG TPA: addiction module toxin, HicA family [Thiotrichaceae bacterium]|nr:addiction module toxin, HicA family [Thiotrichaceae bacterium]
MIEFLLSHGFEQVRQKGSHQFFKHSGGRTATVPDHKGDDLGRGITHQIMKDAEMTREDFHLWLH